MYNARSASVTMAEILEHVGWADLPAIREEIGHLERSWLISGQGEGATRRFRLTQSGEVQLSNHRAHGAQEPPPRSPTREQRVAYLSSAFTDAVEMIDAGETDDATARLSIVAQQAHKYGAHSLGLRAQIGLKRAGGVGQPGLN